jgi:hypothetical protein
VSVVAPSDGCGLSVVEVGAAAESVPVCEVPAEVVVVDAPAVSPGEPAVRVGAVVLVAGVVVVVVSALDGAFATAS